MSTAGSRDACGGRRSGDVGNRHSDAPVFTGQETRVVPLPQLNVRGLS
jgi:hypothetical protein